MPPLPGFTGNPLKTRADVVYAAKAIISPLVQYTSPGCAYVRLPVTSGTLYDDRAARLEGFARPLWVTGSLLASGDCCEELLARVIAGLSNGTDPKHAEYWGDIGDNDQRMVETEPIAFTLLSSPRHLLWDRLEDSVRSNVARWFLQLNGKQIPRVNWLWFRVFTNLVLLKLCEVDDLSVCPQMDLDLEELDSFYLQDGWSSDGLWRSPKDDDDEWLLFQQTGRVHSIKPDRNMYLTEDYNSPQSVYWALKSFVAIMLPSSEPFWAEDEQPYPQLDPAQTVAFLHAPRQLLCNASKGHHFLLSSAQFTSLYWKGAAAKYSKFAYSSAFGFSVPTGQATLQQLAPDNMLALSRDGTQTWATKWKCHEPTFRVCKVHSSVSHMAEELQAMQVLWYPWDDRSVSVTTTLIPPSRRWPDWHIRVHRIRVEKNGPGALYTAEGGFAINGELKNSGQWLQTINPNILDHIDHGHDLQGYVSDTDSAVVFSDTRVSGITGLVLESPSTAGVRQTAAVLRPEANTNIMSARSLLPLVEHEVTSLKQGDELLLCTRVFAIVDDSVLPHRPNGHRWDAWQDRPGIGTSLDNLEDVIDLP
ncbi:unnamed protein product [Clonostachys solani]|uniref:Uncharacterized protein n=1 Tax=Clonostachys solani TaxID=160281 RepID=A0A9N9ZBG4_9HYPO|nr:unnamed protein product [Clonostachys solani]